MDYSISFKINNVDYSSYVQLPIRIVETLDETLDIASLTLGFMAIRKPFKPYTRCEMEITQSGNVPLKYTMLIESDFVEEKQHGKDSLYHHHIKLIELTQILANYYLPDFTITQPITAFAFPKATPSITEDSYNPIVYQYFGNGFQIRDEIFFGDTFYSLKTKYTTPINLANSIMRSYNIRLTATSSYGGSQEIYYSGNVSYTYCYKLHADSTWTAIPDITNWLPAVENYDIKAVMNTITYHYSKWDENLRKSVDAVGTFNSNQTITYSNIEVISTTGDEYIYSIKEGIEKVFSVAKLEEIGQPYSFITLNANTSNKYSLDSLKCPEMTITNGRNMLEILYALGREFNALPRLNADNEIVFDVLENPEDNSTFNDGTELETEEANMTNYANVLVSNVTNMTSCERTKVYPAINRFISCRTDPSEILLNESNMCILLDDNINSLVKVLVKNWNTNDLTQVADITGYIFEKTVYDSLNNSASGKGLALYYSKGSNKIESLGQLPKIQSLLGLQAGDVIIKEILADLTGIPKIGMTSPLTYLYQVEYVPYVNAKINTHNSNNTDFTEDYQANYNQETANINAEAFGKGTQKIIGRIGNNSINKVVGVDNISEIPYLGENKIITAEQFGEVDRYYYADIVDTTFNNNSIMVGLSYSKDFNKINNRVGIDKEYREYSLYANSYVDRTINIDDFCSVSMFTSEEVQLDYTFTALQMIAGIYWQSLQGTTGLAYDGFRLSCYQSDGTTKLQYKKVDGTLIDLSEFIIPVSCNVLGNSISFVGSCYDNFSVGQFLGEEVAGTLANKDAMYVDEKGECPVVELSLGYMGYDFPDTIEGSRIFPIVQPVVGTPLYDGFTKRKFKINKDNRERIKINYALSFVSNQKQTSIHRGASKYVFKDKVISDLSYGSLILVGYNGDIKNKDIISYTSGDILNNFADFTFEAGTGASFYLKTKEVTPLKNYDGVALVWSGTGELLYSFKYPVSTEFSLIPLYIYFNFINKKVDGAKIISV